MSGLLYFVEVGSNSNLCPLHDFSPKTREVGYHQSSLSGTEPLKVEGAQADEVPPEPSSDQNVGFLEAKHGMGMTGMGAEPLQADTDE